MDNNCLLEVRIFRHDLFVCLLHASIYHFVIKPIELVEIFIPRCYFLDNPNGIHFKTIEDN